MPTRTPDVQWLRDRIERLVERRCRLAGAALCPDGSRCAPLRRALDREIVEHLALLRAQLGAVPLGGSFDCPPRPTPAAVTAGDAAADANEPLVLGEPWLSAFRSRAGEGGPERATW
jgi:hypothetical protein